MLATLNDVLIPAKKGRYAVGMFNALNVEMARGVISAAEETRSPVIVGTAEVLLPYVPLENVADVLIPMARRASVPVAVHYDHGITFLRCMEALKLGFTSIMYDCSTDTYEENIRKVAELSRIAHAFGASVEAELGHVGDNEGGVECGSNTPGHESLYTDPRQVKDFVERSGADALAIAVGTAHGPYKLPPKLDFFRIRTIAETIPTPLVLHGGSGLSDDDFRQAIARGISKVNIFTNINIAGAAASKAALNGGASAMTDLMAAQTSVINEECANIMRLFSSDGKA